MMTTRLFPFVLLSMNPQTFYVSKQGLHAETINIRKEHNLDPIIA